MKDKKRTIVYQSPKEGFFFASLAFVQKAFDAIMESDISDKNKELLKAAKVYAESRGIQIEVRSSEILEDIRKLIDFKLMF